MRKILFALLVSQTLADVPVRCSKNDMAYSGAVWTIHVSEGGSQNVETPGTVNLFAEQEVCSHRFPNRI